MTGIIVYVDDNFHYMSEDDRYIFGEFDNREKAITACKQIVDEFLLGAFEPGMSKEALYDSYASFGDDPWFSDAGPKYSSWAYAKIRSGEICGIN